MREAKEPLPFLFLRRASFKREIPGTLEARLSPCPQKKNTPQSKRKLWSKTLKPSKMKEKKLNR